MIKTRTLFAVLSGFVLLISSCSRPQTKKILIANDMLHKLDSSQALEVEKGAHFSSLKVKTESEAESLKEHINHISHELGRCGGFTEESDEEIKGLREVLSEQDRVNREFLESGTSSNLSLDVTIEEELKKLSAENIQNTVELLSGLETRYARADEPNKPIVFFMKHIQESLSKAKRPYSIERVQHKSTKQDSIKVRVEGIRTPDEVVILGGHIDSTNRSWFSSEAPGADDNASGSAVILETLRVLLESNRKPSKSLEFFWYAGEEQGLLGSKEIASDYKKRNVNVAGVMQLDMVLFPGNGGVIGLTSDNTSVELTSYVDSLIGLYLGTKTQRYQCGYGCSDHAAWHSRGFKTVYPFEATMGTHNKNIHTTRDVIDNRSSFSHALKFAKIATAFLIEMSKEPTPEQVISRNKKNF